MRGTSRVATRALLAVAVTGALLVSGLSGPASSAEEQVAGDHGHGAAQKHRSHGPDGIALDRQDLVAAPFAADAEVPWASPEYDGAAYTSDRPDVAGRAGLAMVHAIYVYAREMSSRFPTFGAMFQADMRDASRLLQTQYGRGIRFDERPDTRGGGRPTVVDVTVVHSRYRSAQLGAANQFDVVAGELAADGRFSNPDKKYVVFLDAPSQYCGQGELWQDTRRNAGNASEQRTIAIVYRPYDPNTATTGGFCRGRTLRHELGHNLGALQNVAPHAFDGAHCADSAEDTMCYTFANTPDTGAAVFDYGNDDYWDPIAAGGTTKLPWWTVNLSRFVCPPGGDCSRPNIPEF